MTDLANGNTPLWEFALALYSKPGVEETLLSLQERHGANVPLLLWACWLAARDIPLEAEWCERAQSAIAPCHDTWVTPIRQLRGQLKGDIEPWQAELKQHLLAAELTAEKQVLQQLYELAGRMPQRGEPVSAVANLQQCLAAEVDWGVISQAAAALGRRP